MCSWVWPGVASVRRRQPAQVDLVAVAQPAVGELAVPRRAEASTVAPSVGGELDRAGEEVGVQVGVRGERHGQPPLVGGGAQRAQVAAGVDRERPAVAEVDQVAVLPRPSSRIGIGLVTTPPRVSRTWSILNHGSSAASRTATTEVVQQAVRASYGAPLPPARVEPLGHRAGRLPDRTGHRRRDGARDRRRGRTVQVELLRRGAARAVNLEIATSYEAEAERAPGAAGLGDRVERRVLDIARSPDEVERRTWWCSTGWCAATRTTSGC